MQQGWIVRVGGLVQGVGFRPTVWQVAQARGTRGSVRNTSAGVVIELACDEAERDGFLAALTTSLPTLARIDRLEVEPATFAAEHGTFTIAGSEAGEISASVVADAAICTACAAEIADPSNRRFGYAFANCTHCGPRLTILRAIPYDRANTAMAAFPMCAACRAEYGDPADRRFHAQPIACADCGPRLRLEAAEGIAVPSGDPLAAAAGLILSGHIVAVKGLGGFHLACRADDDSVVSRLRQAKLRRAKPLALMAADIVAVRSIAECSEAEARLLAGPRGPILLLLRRLDAPLAPSVAPGQDRVGLMLPTTPLHALLMKAVGMPLVMTSANESGIPQAITNEAASTLLGPVADAALLHDRDIVSRIDDSVMRLDGPGPSIIRRARGFAPEPLPLPTCLHAPLTVFAAGADLKSAFAFVSRGEAVLSQHLGDLDEAETRDAYAGAVELYASMFDRRPDIVAVDAHPDYVSAALGRALAERVGAELVPVQHHHAHMAACMAENGLEGGTVLVVVLDGSGHGPDGTVWGGEFLVGSYGAFQRVAQFAAVPLIGGDRAAIEPWRNAYAHLAVAFGDDFAEGAWSDVPVVRQFSDRKAAALRSVMGSRRFSPLSSSAGRLFDAVAHLIGIAPAIIGYEGQTGMELEALAAPLMAGAASCAVPQEGDVIGWKDMWEGLLRGLRRGDTPGRLAADFHATLIDLVAAKAIEICRLHRLDTVALTGGVFQNGILLEGVHARLVRSGLRVLLHHAVPANDGGLALGQAAIALCSLTKQKLPRA